MEVQQITESSTAAGAKLAAAERQIKRYRNPEPRLLALRDGYRELQRGSKLIMLAPSIAAAGWDVDGRPRLAVARSDRTNVRFSVISHDLRSSIRFDCRAVIPWSEWGNPYTGSLLRTVPRRLFPARVGIKGTGRAMVPLVPPDAKEEAGNPDLSKCFTLFEAVWEDAPPIDPMLLRHLGGDLYVVLAAWYLTDLERAVMIGDQ